MAMSEGHLETASSILRRGQIERSNALKEEIAAVRKREQELFGEEKEKAVEKPLKPVQVGGRTSRNIQNILDIDAVLPTKPK